MFDFEFHNPTRILFGRGRAGDIGREMAADGVGLALLVSGLGSAERNGTLDLARRSLAGAGVGVVEFPGARPNPVLPHVEAGIALARGRGVDAVLAVGGGSVIDTAKAVAAGAAMDGDLWPCFTGEAGIDAALPVYTVLTLAAAGSEMNRNAVITNPDTRQKYSVSSDLLQPRLSVLDPVLTFTVPPDHTAYGAVDAVVHLLEAYFTKQPGTRLQDRLVEALVRTVMESAGRALAAPDDYQARATMMWAATLALNGLTPAGVGKYGFPNHMIEHALSAIYDIPHGAGLAVVLPAWMRWHAPRNPSQHERFAREIFGRDSAAGGVAALEDWLGEIGAPTRLAHVGVRGRDIPEIAANAAGLARVWGIGDDYPAAVIEEILGLAAEE